MVFSRRLTLWRGAVAIFCMAAAYASNGQSTGLTFGVNTGVGYSDNITRVPESEVDETLGSVGIVLNASADGRLSYSATADLSYVDYFDDTYDSEVTGGFNGSLSYAFVPERFSWVVEDTFGQAQLNLFRPVTPDNREDVNYFTTGPDISLPFSSRNFLDITARYADARYEDSDLDSTRVGGSASLRRQLSGNSLVALTGSSDRIEYDDAADTEYDVRSAYLHYALATTRTTLGIDAGVTELEREDETDDGMLLRLDASRALSPASRLSFAAGQRFSDASDVFRVLQQRSQQPETSPTETTSDAFKYRYATLGWTFEKNRTDLTLSVGLNEEEYVEDVERNRRYTEYLVQLGRRVARNFRATLSARLDNNDYDNIDYEADVLSMQLGLSWRLGARTYLELQYDYFDEDSNDAASEYNENRVFLSVAYFPRGEQF